jgi:Na+/melibiose symporter-like transporter
LTPRCCSPIIGRLLVGEVNIALQSATPPALSLGHKLSYGIGQGAEGIKNGAFGVFLFFYYNQVLALSGTYTGLAVGIALVFDAITDPLVGSVSDNWQSARGRRHPFLFASALPMAFCFFLLLNPPELSEFGLFLWLAVFTTLTRTAMTFYYGPHVALGAELSSDFHERTTIVAYRYFFSYVGVIAAYALGFYVFLSDTPEFPRGQFNVEAYAPLGLTLAVLMAAAIFVTAFGTRSRIPWLPRAPRHDGTVGMLGLLRRMFAEARDALSNRSFAWLFAGVLIVFMMVGVDQSLNLYMNTFFWELKSGENFAFFAASPVGALIGAMVARKLNERFDKKPSVVFGTACWALCQIVPVVLRLLGWFPENGTNELFWTLVVVRFVQGVGVVQALITFGSMIPDIVDEHELRTGRRQEGIFFASVSFSNKFTTGIGSVVGGVALDLIDWPRGVAIQTAADVPPETIAWLGLIYGPIVGGFAVVCLWCYSRYQLDRSRHAEILAELAVVRGQREAAAAAGAA